MGPGQQVEAVSYRNCWRVCETATHGAHTENLSRSESAIATQFDKPLRMSTYKKLLLILRESGEYIRQRFDMEAAKPLVESKCVVIRT